VSNEERKDGRLWLVEEKLEIYLGWQKKLSAWSAEGKCLDFLYCCVVTSYPGVCPQQVEDVACKLPRIRLSVLWTRCWISSAVVFHGLIAPRKTGVR